MTDLIEFLRARLDEDERYADVEGDGHWDCPSTGVLQLGGVEDMDGLMLGPRSVVYHVERWDPARVVREVEAKRRILDWLDATEDWVWDKAYGGQPDCDHVRNLLALPYADHPDYRQEWKP